MKKIIVIMVFAALALGGAAIANKNIATKQQAECCFEGSPCCAVESACCEK